MNQKQEMAGTLKKLIEASGALRLAVVTVVVGVLTAGCGREDVNVYSVSKEPHADTQQTKMPEGHPPVGAAAAPHLKWKTPDGWKEAPLGTMRLASFTVADTNGKQASVSVIPLAGEGGGDLENVNRWRGEVGQPPVAEDELKGLTQTVEVDGLTTSVFDINGKTTDGTAARVVAAILHREGTAWFFKMTGESELVGKQKSAFIEFLKSFQFVADETPPSQPIAQPSRDGNPQWNVPQGWKEGVAGQFLKAKFLIQGEGNTRAEVNVSSAAGDGGGFAANVNRWRQQLGLAALSSDELVKTSKTIEVTDGVATVVEMSGMDARTGSPASVVGVIVTQQQQAWFYKLMGEAKLVELQKDVFLKFVQGVKY